MDSKLVVEQMSGNWKIKHPDMKPLALEANRLAPFGTTYTWVPREQNKHADRLANEALDGKRHGVTVAQGRSGSEAAPTEATDDDRGRRAALGGLAQAGADDADPGPARRHRSTRWRSGSPAACPARTPASATRAARRSAPWPTGWRRSASGWTRCSPRPYAARGSPARSSPSASAARSQDEPGFAEMDFGTWDGLTFEEVAEPAPRGPRRLARHHRRAAGRRRVAGDGAASGCWRRSTGCWPITPGRTVVVASHVTPIKVVVAEAIQAPLSRSSGWSCGRRRSRVVTFFTPPGDGPPPTGAERHASLRQFNTLAPGRRPVRRVDPLVEVPTGAPPPR